MDRFASMQRRFYEADAANWSISNRDPVVGSFDAHNSWSDYEYLFADLPADTSGMDALDFACGPGRNLVKFNGRFKSYDGVDLSLTNLEKAKEWLAHHDISGTALYHCNGVDLSNIPDASYDVVTSTIALQHICVHKIRLNYFSEFHRILRPGGYVTLQMGFGGEVPTKRSVPYLADFFDADGTNGSWDTRVEDPKELEADLRQVGFQDFTHHIRPVGPGDGHPAWIFFKGGKPPF